MKELGNTPADKNYKPSGISRAKEAALKAYPPLSVASVCLDGTTPVDLNTGARKRFIEGYETAEKDLALTWEDMRKIIRIDEEMMDDPEAHPEWMEEQPFYEEMLRRFKEAKK